LYHDGVEPRLLLKLFLCHWLFNPDIHL
jgi:hypothetical protein